MQRTAFKSHHMYKQELGIARKMSSIAIDCTSPRLFAKDYRNKS